MTRIGIISDTHIPQRWPALHDSLPHIFKDVDLILHAGDVGKLWVLDEIGQIAPVIAVHGNDETDEATAALPYLQTVVIGGRRIVITHSHYPDRAEEMESRKIDDWHPKLKRLAKMALDHDARLLVYGHTHIPMCIEYDGVLIFNPCWISSGGFFLRQTMQSVATLELNGRGTPQITHHDLNRNGQPFSPSVDVDAGFKAAWLNVNAPIVTQDIHEIQGWLFRELIPIAGEQLFNAMLPVLHRAWKYEIDYVTPEMVVQTLRADNAIPLAVYDVLRESDVFAPYL